jgi:hypothetical protein
MKLSIWTVFFCSLGCFAAQPCSQQPLNEALTAACQELQKEPRSSSAHYRIGEELYHSSDYQSAANEYRETLNGNLEPRSLEFWAHIGLGRVYATLHIWSGAGNEFAQAVKARDDKDVAQMEALFDLAAMAPAKADGVNTPLPDLLKLTPKLQDPSEPIETTPADYTDEARTAELEGTVRLQATIGADGVAKDFTVSGALGLGLEDKAIESAKHWLFPKSEIKPEVRSSIGVDFLFPAKTSRWHLIGVRFESVEGISRAKFLTTRFPAGAGIFTRAAVEEGRVIGAIGRQATATISFDINELGIPVDLHVDWMSDTCWGPEAVALVQEWRFTPGVKDEKPVRTRAAVDLLWGPFNLSAITIERNLSAISNRITDKAARSLFQ